VARITVQIGAEYNINGRLQSDLRPVEFEAEQLAEHSYFVGVNGELPTESRGAKETLYRVSDGRLVVYVERWSRWQDEPNEFLLKQVSKEDFDVGGVFEALGRRAGLGRPLTLDEALS
jgi:hypothetical protein